MKKWYSYPTATRPVAMGVNGLVSSGSMLASDAGLQVLKDGGNAIDAAVATAATLNVVEPYMSGVGGTGLALVYVAKEDRVRALNFSGRAPQATQPSRFTEKTKERGILSSLVPGNVAGWLTLHEEYGTLDRERLFQSAIQYAESGFPFTFQNSYVTGYYADRLRPYPTSAAIMLDNAMRAPKPGTRLTMPQLAKSLRKIAMHGKEVFYTGELAECIVQANQSMGGLFTMADFTEFTIEWQTLLTIGYRGYDVYTTAPNSVGFQILQTLKLIEGLDPSDLRFQDIDSLHLQMEATKLCITDRIKYAGDPDHVDIPLDGLLTNGYASEQRKRIDLWNAAAVSGEQYSRVAPGGALAPGNPERSSGGNTTHFAAADRDGNVVSITQTLGGFFGSGVAIGDTGIFLNDMAMLFDLDEESPNAIGPGRRPASAMAPTQTLREGKFYLSMGTPGGWGIAQTTPQLLMNVLDLGMNVQQAIEAPQFRHYVGRNVHMEERFPHHVRRALEMRGHQVTVLEAWSMRVGGAHGIVIDNGQGVFQGGADPRRDGFALGW